MKIQHLVLDEDVHKALKARKKKTNTTVKEIGNSALRAALSIPTKEDLVVQKLVETGKMTREDYEVAKAAASKEVKAAHKRAAEVASPQTDSETWVMGSWEVREAYLSPDSRVQMLDMWARDTKKVAMGPIAHDESDVWATVIQGKALLEIGGETRLLTAHESVHISPGTVHAATPLTRATRAAVLVVPPTHPELPRRKSGAGR